MQWIRRLVGALVVGAVVGISPGARAEAPQAPVKAGPVAAPPAAPARGLAVLAQGDAGVPGWALARAIYGDPGLLPQGLGEAHARALVGEAVSPDAPHDVRDLAEMRAAIHGDDAPSRSLLTGIAASLHLKGVVVVEASPDHPPVARVFVAGTGAFDAVLYQPDPLPPVTWGSAPAATTWSSAANALHRSFAEVAAAVPVENRGAPPGSAGGVSAEPAGPAGSAGGLGVSPLAPVAPGGAEPPKSGSRPFYASPWFWGALGAAAFAGLAVYFATRDSTDPSIQLSVQVPK